MQSARDRSIQLAIAIGLIAIAVRFVALNQFFVDEWSWRQSDVAAIARNFFQNGFHFAHPQIDWAGDQPGYVGTEFPILPFIAAVCYKFLGVHEWIGRIQAVLFFAASLPVFFLLVRKWFDRGAATWATFFYGFAPLSIMASRCFIPDIPSLSLSIIGLYLFVRWSENERWSFLLAAAVTTSLALLIKLPTALIGVPMAYIAFRRFGLSAFRRLDLWIFAALTLLPSCVWYWHAHRIAEAFYPYHFFGSGGVRLEGPVWYWKIARRTAGSSLTPVLFILAVAGVWTARSRPSARVLYWWLGAAILFIIVTGYGNRHQWYQLPLVPLAAAFAGDACDRFALRYSGRRSVQATAAVILILLFGALSYHYTTGFYREPAADLRKLGLELKRMTPEKSLIVAADFGDPTVFYYAERKGWNFLERDGIYDGSPTSSAAAIADLEQLRGQGAAYIVFYPGTMWWLVYYTEFARHIVNTAVLKEATPSFLIYKLNPPAK